MWPKLIVPLQIDLAIEAGRYLFRRSANPSRLRTAVPDAAEVSVQRGKGRQELTGRRDAVSMRRVSVVGVSDAGKTT